MIEQRFSPHTRPMRLLILALASLTVAVSAFAVKRNVPPGVTVIASTVPANGDINPYGLAQEPTTTGKLKAGHFLVSNFNSSANLQGTGTTIIDMAPSGATSLFAQIDPNTLPGTCTGGVGLTTALVVLKTGWVIVGSLPTTDGSSDTAAPGCLLVLNSTGSVVETFYGSLINGPWDMTALDNGNQVSLFYTNVLNGTQAGNGSVVNGGTVVRMNLNVSTSAIPAIQSMTVIGSGFSERTDPAALVIGPTGVGLSGTTLYVADALNNRVAAISSATTRTTSAGAGTTFSVGGYLNDPLGLAVNSSGDVLVTNGNNGLLVTLDSSGNQIAWNLIDNNGNPPGAGALFGLVPTSAGVYFVDDATNTFNLFQ